jgi:hypothetical protein
MLSPLVQAAATSAVASARETRRILTMASQITGGQGITGPAVRYLDGRFAFKRLCYGPFPDRVEPKPEH